MDTDCRTTDITFLCYYEIYYYQIDSGNVSVEMFPFICSHILFLPSTPVLQILVGEHYCTPFLIKMDNHHMYPFHPLPPPIPFRLSLSLSLTLTLSLPLSLSFPLSLSLSLPLPLLLSIFLPTSFRHFIQMCML